MKKYILITLFFINGYFTFGQGLEKIIVEKYYISETKDSTVLGGRLPSGSVTYRIFVDMLPGYRFQAAFGIPGHELRLATTTTFFNHPDYGGTVANVIPFHNLVENTVMLDSWLSTGGASDGNFGILKAKDKNIETVINKNGSLQNADPAAGIPISEKDGLIAGAPARVTGFGIDSIINVFNKTSNGSLFSTTNGSWASLYGSIGPDSLDNEVLIAQITTDGIFSFELNIQIGTPDGLIEQYVAQNPSGKEIEFPGLKYHSNVDSLKTKNKLKVTGKANKQNKD